jgi:hypothetical protein
MKTGLWILAGSLMLAGCATSTIETRRQERYSSYSELPAEQKAAIDNGKIKVGMSMDAVYIAWGKPAEVLTSESSKGTLITWLYRGSYLQEYRYWTHHDYYYRRGYYATPHLAYDYYPQSYVSAEVIFEGGVVKEWRNLPAPGY